MTTVSLGPAYTRLWSATALANLGDGIRAAALPLLAATLTSSPALVAGVAVATLSPWLLFGLVAGAIVDRVDRRMLVAAVDTVRVVLIAALVVAVATGHANLALVYLVAFACGVGETLRDTATATLLPALVPPEQLARANGRLINAEIAGNELIGPPLGGYLFGVALVLPFAVNGGGLALVVLLVLSLPNLFAPTPTSPDVRRSIRHDIGDGVRWLAGHRRLRTLAVLGAAFAMADSAWFAILVLYVAALGLPAAGFGLLLAVGAVGGLVGGFAAAGLIRRVGSTAALVGSLLAAAAAQAALGLTTVPAVAGAALALSSFAFGVWNVAGLTLRQTLTPTALLGRVTSAFRTVVIGAAPIGALLGGVTATILGLRAPILLGVPVLVAAALVGWRTLRTE